MFRFPGKSQALDSQSQSREYITIIFRDWDELIDGEPSRSSVRLEIDFSGNDILARKIWTQEKIQEGFWYTTSDNGSNPRRVYVPGSMILSMSYNITD